MAGKDAKAASGKIYRFSKTARVTHWVYAGCYLVLLLTGLLLFADLFDFLAPVFGGFSGAQLIHRIVAVIYLLPVLIFLLFDPKNFFGWLKEIFTWTKDDFKALPIFFKGLLGLEDEMPPQGFLNSGEKVNSLLTIFFTILIVLSGIVLWRANALGVELMRWAYVIHSGSVALLTPVAIMHIYMGILNPSSKAALTGMFYGYIDAEYAKSHHRKWYDKSIMTGKE